MRNYSVLMGNAMNLCKGMPNRSDSARDLLHDTVTKTLDYFSKGKDLPLEEMHFWMIRVMENTFKDIKKSARSRLEVQQATSTSENNDDSDYTDIKRTTMHADPYAREIDVSDADNKLFPHSLSLQIDGESKLNINQCWEKLEAEGQRLLLLNLIDKKSMTTKQIAKKIKKPLGSVCTLLNRYKIQLYQCLKEAI